jgi:small subunit ribosomal protein S6
MRLYETTFILSPQADDAAFDRQIKAVGDVIHRYEGKVVRENRWGIRRLAYPIRRFTQGYYTRVIFEGNLKVLSELERFYKIEEPYIRYLTVLFEGNLEEEPGDDYNAGRHFVAAEKPAEVPKEIKAPVPEIIKPVDNTPSRAKPPEEKTKYDDSDI